jgi:hypothetical protein
MRTFDDRELVRIARAAEPDPDVPTILGLRAVQAAVNTKDPSEDPAIVEALDLIGEVIDARHTSRADLQSYLECPWCHHPRCDHHASCSAALLLRKRGRKVLIQGDA